MYLEKVRHRHEIFISQRSVIAEYSGWEYEIRTKIFISQRNVIADKYEITWIHVSYLNIQWRHQNQLCETNLFCKADGIQINLTVQGVSPGAALISMKLFFQGSLPLLMMFDLPDDILIDDGCVQGLQGNNSIDSNWMFQQNCWYTRSNL